MVTRGKWGAVKDRDPIRAKKLYARRNEFEVDVNWTHLREEYIAAIKLYLASEPNTNVLKSKGDAFIAECQTWGISPIFALAVAIHETGHGQSRFLKEYNNAFGIQPKGEDGAPAPYPTINDSIKAFCKMIKLSYVNCGQRTLVDIADHPQKPEGHSYCGDFHDSVSRLDWIEGIKALMDKIWTSLK